MTARLRPDSASIYPSLDPSRWYLVTAWDGVDGLWLEVNDQQMYVSERHFEAREGGLDPVPPAAE
ncbi:MAG TPA: hypothetical protein VGA78_03860 [Gemmatimonadales bacterium]|jgi:hypothetical protein